MKEPRTKHKGIKRLFFALFHSLSGLICAIRTEAAFQQELILAILLIPLALLIPFKSPLKPGLLIYGTFMVLIIELINCCIEKTVNFISEEYNEQAKEIKDIASAAVFLSLCTLTGLWIWSLSEFIEFMPF